MLTLKTNVEWRVMPDGNIRIILNGKELTPGTPLYNKWHKNLEETSQRLDASMKRLEDNFHNLFLMKDL